MSGVALDRNRRRLRDANPPGLPRRLAMRDVIASSFKNFHTKGFDYICLQRTPKETLKVYIFDGVCAKMPSIVAPHDHRYDFRTWIIAGKVENVLFDEDARGDRYQRFDYRTPLNGGDGFESADEARLLETACNTYTEGQSYGLFAEQIHTIAIREPQTMLLLRQHEDTVAIDAPTATYMPGDTALPPLGGIGLYERFAEVEIRERLALISRLIGLDLEAE